MKYLTLLLTVLLTATSFGCPSGNCQDKDCPQAKVHTTGVGGGVTEPNVHGHDAEHADERAKFLLKPEGTPREVKSTKPTSPKAKNG